MTTPAAYVVAASTTTEAKKRDFDSAFATTCDCDAHNLATIFCQDCNSVFCNECNVTIHGKHPTMRIHSRIEINEDRFQFALCSEHHMKIIYVNNDHTIFWCAQCVIPPSADGIEKEQLPIYLKNLRDDLRKRLEKIEALSSFKDFKDWQKHFDSEPTFPEQVEVEILRKNIDTFFIEYTRIAQALTQHYHTIKTETAASHTISIASLNAKADRIRILLQFKNNNIELLKQIHGIPKNAFFSFLGLEQERKALYHNHAKLKHLHEIMRNLAFITSDFQSLLEDNTKLFDRIRRLLPPPEAEAEAAAVVVPLPFTTARLPWNR